MGNLLIDRTSMEPHFPEVLARFEVNTSFCLHAGSLGHLVRTIGYPTASCLASHPREKLTGEVRSSDHPREVVYVPCITYAHKHMWLWNSSSHVTFRPCPTPPLGVNGQVFWRLRRNVGGTNQIADRVIGHQRSCEYHAVCVFSPKQRC